MGSEKIRVNNILEMKRSWRKISVVTAYDYSTAVLADRAEIDIVLVGDSLGMVVLGYGDTTSVTMDDMMVFCKAVRRGVKNALVVGDMPFLSYQVSREEAVRNAGRLIKEAGVDAVKLEGGSHLAGVIRGIVEAGIPVMGHIGLLPQTADKWTGYRLQGKSWSQGIKIFEDAVALEEAGVFSTVLESIPAEVSRIITEKTSVPTIGIGAGQHCDGQVLVSHDLLGIFEGFTPKFVKKYADLSKSILDAFKSYKLDVQSSKFPMDKHTFHMSEAECAKMIKALAKKKGKNS